jgi:hypothetical protein
MLTMEVTLVRDDRLPSLTPPRMVVSEGPAMVQYTRVIPAAQNTTNPSYTINPPSVGSGVSRCMYLHVRGYWTVTGTNVDRLVAADRVALRAMPIQSMIGSSTMTFGNAAVSANNNLIGLQGQLRISNLLSSTTGVQSGTAAGFDVASEYDTLPGTIGGPFQPVGDWAMSGSSQTSRTGHIEKIMVDVTSTTTVLYVVADMIEPICLPVLTYTDEGRSQAMYGLTTATYTYNLVNFQRGLSLSLQGGGGAVGVTSVTFTPIVQNLYVDFITPSDRTLVPRPIPASYTYNCPDLEYFTTTLNGLANPAAASGDPYANISGNTAGGGTSPTQAVIPLSQVSGAGGTYMRPVIPERIAIWVSDDQSALMLPTSCGLASSFMPITSLSISAGTSPGSLNNADLTNLWAMSRRNGAEDIPLWCAQGMPGVTADTAKAFANQRFGSGYVVVLDVARDIGLPPGICPGMQMPWQFSITNIVASNNRRTAATAAIVILMITPGTLVLGGPESGLRCIGGVPGTDTSAFKVAGVTSADAYRREMNTSGVGGSVKGWFDQIGRNIRSSVGQTRDALNRSLGETHDELQRNLAASKTQAWRTGDAIKHAWEDTVRSVAQGAAQGATSGGRRAPKALMYY